MSWSASRPRRSLNCLSAECSIEREYIPGSLEYPGNSVSIAFRLNARSKVSKVSAEVSVYDASQLPFG